MMDDESWKPDNADYWKDADWKARDADYWKDPARRARDAIRFMKECTQEIFRIVPCDILLSFRAQYVSQRRTDYVAMIDEQLERRFGIKGGQSTPNEQPNSEPDC